MSAQEIGDTPMSDEIELLFAQWNKKDGLELDAELLRRDASGILPRIYYQLDGWFSPEIVMPVTDKRIEVISIFYDSIIYANNAYLIYCVDELRWIAQDNIKRLEYNLTTESIICWRYVENTDNELFRKLHFPVKHRINENEMVEYINCRCAFIGGDYE
jgi:hypothetical protein